VRKELHTAGERGRTHCPNKEAYVAMVPNQLGVNVGRSIEATSGILKMPQLETAMLEKSVARISAERARARRESEATDRKREREM
jgi:hypothetical protein